MQLFFANITEHQIEGQSEHWFDNNSLSFSVRYAYLSVFSNSFRASDELFAKKEMIEFRTKCRDFERDNPKAAEEALFQISALIDSRAIIRVLIAFEKIFNQLKQKYEYERVGLKSFNVEVANIRRCVLTPTRLLIYPPVPQLKNRFIINSNPDYSLRLTIRDDNLQPLCYTVQRSSNSENQINFIKKIVKTPLLSGQKVSGRLFEFLGTSSSQLRDNGMILYAKDNSLRTAQSIRESVGDLSKIRKNVPKYMARLGLIFSQGMTHIQISESARIEVYPDIEGCFKPDFRFPQYLTQEKYVFSDGIGMISPQICELIYKQLPNDCLLKPSAFQIRIGGCKGMLTVNPRLKGEHIILRESMKKFESNDRTLAILKVSAARPVYLNRPLITILEQMGVESKVFLVMLMEDLKSLANSLLCECSALTLFQNWNRLCIPYEKLFGTGIPVLNEPIFRGIVDVLIPYRIKELKSKARIKVSMNRGRNLLGVLDETGTLQYGQVFARLSYVDKDDFPIDRSFVVEGQVMVTKFPCLHPGDVRKLTAVDVPALHHIKDCLVFPASGTRPHTDEMAGSDLDGDEYALFWNSDLIFSRDNFPPMHFPSGKAPELDHNAEVEDILDFYCKHILTNTVGLTASAHLANADSLDTGIFDEICMSLAAKYAVALDFVKTGIVNKIEREEKPKKYPDFMEKLFEDRTYLSRHVLGQMYRQCCTFELGIQTQIELEIDAQPNPQFIIEGWEVFEELATKAFLSYKDRIEYLLNTFGVSNEAVLLSGCFTITNRKMTGRTEMNDTHELVASLVGALFTQFKHRFKTECQFSNNEERRRMASAWYAVTYKLNENQSQTFFGFPFTITNELCKIVDKKSSIGSNQLFEPHDCVRNSAKVLDQYLINEGLHTDPALEKSLNFAVYSENRLKLMESRFTSAEAIIENWLQRQKNMFFSQQNPIVESEINLKLRNKINDLRRKVMNEAVEPNNAFNSLRTTGNIVMSFMKELVEERLSLDSFLQNNSVFDIRLIKFGFSALLALNYFFRTHRISHIIESDIELEFEKEPQIEKDSFYFEVDELWLSYIDSNPTQICQNLQEMTGVIEVHIHNDSINNNQTNRRQSFEELWGYSLSDIFPNIDNNINTNHKPIRKMTASGSVWSLQTLKNLVTHHNFSMIFNTSNNSDFEYEF